MFRNTHKLRLPHYVRAYAESGEGEEGSEGEGSENETNDGKDAEGASGTGGKDGEGSVKNPEAKRHADDASKQRNRAKAPELRRIET